MHHKILDLDIAKSRRGLWASSDEESFLDGQAVIRYLRDCGLQPLILRRRLRSPGVTVELEVLGLPKGIRLFISPMPDDEKQQEDGIVAGLRILHIDARVST